VTPRAVKPIDAVEPSGDEVPKAKPRRSRAKKAEVPADVLPAEPMAAVGPVPDASPETASSEPRRQGREPRRSEGRRDEPRRDDARRREEPRRDEPRREEALRPVDTRPWNERRPRDSRRRDEDLGPSVLGFGDDVPAFMLLRSRSKRTARAGAAAEAE